MKSGAKILRIVLVLLLLLLLECAEQQAEEKEDRAPPALHIESHPPREYGRNGGYGGT